MNAQKSFVISVMARDRVGIVAAVSETVDKLKGNIGAMSQTVLSGYFTIILTADFPRPLAPEKLRDLIESAGGEGELAVSILPRARAAEAPAAGFDVFVLSIQGRDRPGVIAKISSFLKSRAINIIDLYSASRGAEFVFVSQVMVPKRLDVGQLKIDLETLIARSGLTVDFQHENIFLSTQQVDFPGAR